ncbi:MAG: elongation factor G [Planctomycetes bacterium]|nr:elongation factor G [Planctomycetota bacterium]
MAKHKVEEIRTVALVGHGAGGKTSLADALLFAAKAVDRRGNVDEGSSVSDFDDEEKKRKFSIDTSVLHLEHKGKQVYLLDTPGYPDFVGGALAALNAVENAVIVVSAPNGIQVNTRRMFKEAGKRELARMVVLNKLDADNIDFEGLVDSLRNTFGKSCVLFNAPNGVGAKFTSVIGLLNPPPGPSAPIDLNAARSQLIDAVVEADEELLMKYLDEGSVSAEELASALPKAIATGSCIPIFCTSVKKDIGIAELLEGISQFALSPAQGRKRMLVQKDGAGTKEVPLEAREDGPFVAQVFKTLSDKFVGNLSFLRVYSGKISSDQALVNERTSKSSRNTGLLQLQGKTQQNVTEAVPGDIIAVAKIEDLRIGDTVGTAAGIGHLPGLSFPTPMFGLAVEPKARGDEQKISGSLQKIADEDPTFHVNRDTQTKEMVITGMSQLHLDVVQHRLKRRFDLEVITREPKIPYRETITSRGEANYRHKKQSGGRGQFGEVHLRIYPLKDEGIASKEDFFAKFAIKERFEKLRVDNCRYDADFNFGFLDSIVGGTIPNQFVPAVEKGCRELLERGALAGYRIQDVAVEVYFGKDHPVDSSEQAFKTASRIAFKNAFLGAKPVLLEPIVDLEVTVPMGKTGDLLGYLNTKRGRIENQESLPGDLAVVKAKAPLAELSRLAADLNSMTGGQASYTMDFSHYDVVPGNVQQQIVAKAKVAADEEE